MMRTSRRKKERKKMLLQFDNEGQRQSLRINPICQILILSIFRLEKSMCCEYECIVFRRIESSVRMNIRQHPMKNVRINKCTVFFFRENEHENA